MARKSGSWIRGWVYVGSFALHAALAFTTLALPNEKRGENAAIELADIRKMKKKEPPKVPLPPPPPPPEEKPKPPPPPPKAASQAKVAADTPKAEAPPVDMGADGFADLGVSRGGGGGGGDGVGIPMGGGPSAVAAAAPGAAAKPKAVTKKAVESLAPSAADTCNDPPVRPKVKVPLTPKYTLKAREAEIEGRLRVEVVVDEHGNVISAKVLNGLGYGLDEEALATAKKLVFEPATRCGRAVVGKVIVPFRFQLGS